MQAASAGKGPICDTQTFTKVEDRPIVKEVKTYVREHHPVEKEVSKCLIYTCADVVHCNTMWCYLSAHARDVRNVVEFCF